MKTLTIYTIRPKTLFSASSTQLAHSALQMGGTMYLTSQLIPRKRAFLEKLIVPCQTKNFPAFHIKSFLHKIQTFLRILSQMKPIHDPLPHPPYMFLAKSLVTCTWCIETFGCVKSTSLVLCLLTVQKMFASFGESLCTRWHNPQDLKSHTETFLVWSTFPYEPDE